MLHNRFKILFHILFLFCTFLGLLEAKETKELEKVSLQLHWKFQFEFAGFIAAKEKGFYKEAGFDVTLKTKQRGMDVLEELVKGKSTFAISDDGCFIDAAEGNDIKIIANYYKQSPHILVAQQNIYSPYDLMGKTIMTSKDTLQKGNIKSMMTKLGIDTSKIKVIPHTFNLDAFINNEIDAMTVYTIDQIYELNQAKKQFSIFNPVTYGISSSAINLVTIGKELYDKPRIDRFVEASNKGWEYALNHKQEIVDIIYEKYSQHKTKPALLHEADQVERLMLPNLFPIGSIDRDLFKREIANMKLDKSLPEDFDFEKMVYEKQKLETDPNIQLSEQEKAWIKDHPVIHVGGEMDWVPFDFVNDNKKYDGLAKDYLDLIAQKGGFEVQYHTGKTWSELLEAIKNKEIDLLPALNFSEARAEFINYTHSYLKLPEYYFTRSSSEKIKGINELYGKSLAIVKGFAINGWLKENHPQIKLNEKSSILEALRSVKSEESFAFICDNPSTTYHLENNFITGIKLNNIVETRAPVKLYMGVKKGYEPLVGIINKTLQSIKKEDISKISSKWMNAIEKETVIVNLTQEEKNWIKENVIKVGVEDWAPIIFPLKESHDIGGISGGIFKLLVQRTGLQVDYVSGFWDDLLQKFKKKQIDLLPDTYYSKEREKYGVFSQGYMKLLDAIYVKETDNHIYSFQDLNNKKLALVKDTGMAERIKENFPNIEILETKNLLDAIYAVTNGRADALYDGQVAVRYTLKENVISGLKEIPQTYFKALDLHLFSQMDQPILQSILQKGLQSISYQEIQDIRSQWVDQLDRIKLNKQEQEWLDENREIKYVYDANWQPFEWKNELGEHTGIIYDILSLISEKSGIVFQQVPTNSWDEAFELVKNKKVDMFSGIAQTDERKEYLQFSQKVIFNIPYVFVSRVDDPNDYLETFKVIENKSVGVVSGYGIEELLEEKQPNLPLFKVQTIDEGFSKVKDKTLDIFVVNAATAKYYINKKGYDDLKIVTKTEFNLDLKVAFHQGFSPVAIDIIDRAIGAITQKELSNIYFKWTEVRVETTINWKLIYQISAGLLIIVLIIAYWNRKLKSLVDQKTGEIKLLLNAFDKNVIASKTDKNGVITYVSEKFCKISGYKKEELLGKTHTIIKHPDMPQEVFENMWSTIKANRVWIGEVKNLKKDGGFYWTDMVITPEYDIKGVLSGYSAIRQDITAQKEVEELSRTLEHKVEQRTKELNDQKKQIEAIHKHTRESIEYASLIQGALIPEKGVFDQFFEDYFTLWQPKDIVGGDIYLMHKVNDDEIVLMVIDCTGHGVPGAFVTMLVKAVERQIMSIVNTNETNFSPADTLSVFNQSIKHLLKQENLDSVSNAGFDGGIIYYNRKENLIKFAGAETPLFYIDKEQKFHTIKGSRHSVGYKKSDPAYQFKEHTIEVKKGMLFYLSTDGFLDQNGGEKSFPFGKKRFQKLIEKYKDKSLETQKEFFLEELSIYQGNNERNDDVTMIGIKV